MSHSKPVWYCKIGLLPDTPRDLPDVCDLPMREAVRRAFREITGEWPDFVFSGWNQDIEQAELNGAERDVVEDRHAREVEYMAEIEAAAHEVVGRIKN